MFLGMLFSWCEVDGVFTMNVFAYLTVLNVEILDPSKSCDYCRGSLCFMNTHEIIQMFCTVATFIKFMATCIYTSLCYPFLNDVHSFQLLCFFQENTSWISCILILN